MSFLSVLWPLIVGVAALPAIVLWVQVVSARPPAQRRFRSDAPRPAVVVLIPAHNEGRGIEGTLRSVMPELRDGDRVLVVADNCSDETAAVAQEAGACVISRHDLSRRGKGYALDFGIRHLEREGTLPDSAVVLMVDADCRVHPGSIDVLASTCADTGRPVQSLDLMQALPQASLGQRLGELAWKVKNEVRPLGWGRLGAPCPLMGTGMAFPWSVIRHAPLASGHLVEDMRLGTDLALAGHLPLFVPQALVTSYFPNSEDAAKAQRKRWEHGHLATLLACVPRLLWAGFRSARPALVAMALDLLIPPLALLLLVHIALAAVSFGVLGLWLGQWWLAGVCALPLVLLFTSLMRAWSGFGREIVTARELLAAPVYALRKLPLYAGFLAKRQAEWVRAKRDGE